METNLEEAKTGSWHIHSDIIDELINDVRCQMELKKFQLSHSLEELMEFKERYLQGELTPEDGPMLAAMIGDLERMQDVLLGKHAEEYKAKHGNQLLSWGLQRELEESH